MILNNHPGVMLQICGLSARRAFNLEGIFCTAIDRGKTSCIWLKVVKGGKLDQVIKQLSKLEDVLSVEERKDTRSRFGKIKTMLVQIH